MIMKLPKTFLPEKDLEKKVTDLKLVKKYKIKSLNDLVLWRDSEEFMNCTNIPNSGLMKDYQFLDTKSVYGGFCVTYDDVLLNILEFVDQSSLGDNKKNIKKCLNKFNDKQLYSQCSAIVKDRYVIFVYPFLGDYDNRYKFIGAYKKKFGFRELKQ